MKQMDTFIKRAGKTHLSNTSMGIVLGSALLTMVGSGAKPQTGSVGTITMPTGVQPLTTVDTTMGKGYFVDPLPIHLPGPTGSYVPSLSGTTKQILNCSSLASQCYYAGGRAVTIEVSEAVQQQLARAGSTLVPFDNFNIYQDNGGTWQMAVTAYVKNAQANPRHAP